ncbi:MAG: hypothetical protein M3N57_01755, partial [Actinomycetota bacterium]|nr:hypothetical protein [Actinomycetota bacterium]
MRRVDLARVVQLVGELLPADRGLGGVVDVPVGERGVGSRYAEATRQTLGRVLGRLGGVPSGVGEVGIGQIEVVGVPAAGRRDVAPLAVDGFVGHDQGVVDGQPLGLVTGDRVAVCEVALGEVVGRQRDLVIVAVGPELERAVGMDRDDGGTGAVVNVEPPVVAQAHHPVPGREPTSVRSAYVATGDLAGLDAALSGGAVELVDLPVGPGDH